MGRGPPSRFPGCSTDSPTPQNSLCPRKQGHCRGPLGPTLKPRSRCPAPSSAALPVTRPLTHTPEPGAPERGPKGARRPHVWLVREHLWGLPFTPCRAQSRTPQTPRTEASPAPRVSGPYPGPCTEQPGAETPGAASSWGVRCETGRSRAGAFICRPAGTW